MNHVSVGVNLVVFCTTQSANSTLSRRSKTLFKPPKQEDVDDLETVLDITGGRELRIDVIPTVTIITICYHYPPSLAAVWVELRLAYIPITLSADAMRLRP